MAPVCVAGTTPLRLPSSSSQLARTPRGSPVTRNAVVPVKPADRARLTLKLAVAPRAALCFAGLTERVKRADVADGRRTAAKATPLTVASEARAMTISRLKVM